MKYTIPYVAKYGNYKNVIQGECGLGVENFTLDKTGSSYRTVYVNYFKLNHYCVNNVCYDQYEHGCEYQTRCNGESDC